jgi:hypothetical protein
MATITGEAAGLSLLAFEGAALSFSAWLPSGLTIRTFADSDLGRKDLWDGIKMGVVFNLIMGTGAAILAKSTLPFFAAVAGSLVGIYIYAHFMQTAHGLGAMRNQPDVP